MSLDWAVWTILHDVAESADTEVIELFGTIGGVNADKYSRSAFSSVTGTNGGHAEIARLLIEIRTDIRRAGTSYTPFVLCTNN
jgi:hypothetical protein